MQCRRDWRRVAEQTAADVSLQRMPFSKLDCAQRRAIWLESTPMLIRRHASYAVGSPPQATSPLWPLLKIPTRPAETPALIACGFNAAGWLSIGRTTTR